MSVTTSENPVFDGVWFRPQVITADDAAVSGLNTIGATVKTVEVTGVTNDADDFVVLPAAADVPNGHEITILANAGSNFEVRTPADSDTLINNVNSDGTNEYLITDGQVHRFVKVSNTQGWIAYGFTNLGAVATAVVPD